MGKQEQETKWHEIISDGPWSDDEDELPGPGPWGIADLLKKQTEEYAKQVLEAPPSLMLELLKKKQEPQTEYSWTTIEVAGPKVEIPPNTDATLEKMIREGKVPGLTKAIKAATTKTKTRRAGKEAVKKLSDDEVLRGFTVGPGMEPVYNPDKAEEKFDWEVFAAELGEELGEGTNCIECTLKALLKDKNKRPDKYKHYCKPELSRQVNTAKEQFVKKARYKKSKMAIEEKRRGKSLPNLVFCTKCFTPSPKSLDYLGYKCPKCGTLMPVKDLIGTKEAIDETV